MARSQSSFKLTKISPSSSSSSSPSILAEAPSQITHNPNAKGEAMVDAYFPESLPEIMLGYLDEIAETKEVTCEKRQQFKLFGRNIQTVLQRIGTRAARLFLGGEENEVKEALDLVKKYPDILRCRVKARDRVGSPALCVMTEEPIPRYDVCLIFQEEKEDKVEPNKLYVGIDERRENLYYQVAVNTIRGREVITVPIQANKLIPASERLSEFTSEKLKIYQSQILKLAANRGHIDNKLHMQLTEQGDLNYTVLTPEGVYVDATITQEELNQKIEVPLTLQKLNALQGDILEITSKRGHTPYGREQKGSLLEIVVIGAGDVDLQAEIKDEKDHGVAEQLIAKKELSQEEVDETSKRFLRAKLNNEIKNHRILLAIKKLGMDICKINKDGINALLNDYAKFRAFQTRCQLLIDQFDEELNSDPSLIVDINVLHQAASWFEKEVTKFGGWYSPESDVFWVTLGLVQLKLSTRDRQAIKYGIGNVVDKKAIPPRTLIDAGGSSHFNSSSRIGRDVYLGYYGGSVVRGGQATEGGARLLESYVNQKQQHCKTYATSQANKKGLVFGVM